MWNCGTCVALSFWPKNFISHGRLSVFTLSNLLCPGRHWRSEDELGAVLFDWDRRGHRLTAAGAVFLQDTRRIHRPGAGPRERQGCRGGFARQPAHRRIRRRARSPAVGVFGPLPCRRTRDRDTDVRSAFCRAVARPALRRTLHRFAHTADVGDGIVAEPIWQDPLVVALPARHALLVHKGGSPMNSGASSCPVRSPGVRGYCRELARLLQTRNTN